MNYEIMTSKKALDLALSIIALVGELESRHEYVLAKQVLKSGTSVGVDLPESRGVQSKKDFVAKIHISLKEVLETRYWLELLVDSKKISKETGQSMQNQCSELIAIMTTTLKTVKSKMD